MATRTDDSVDAWIDRLGERLAQHRLNRNLSQSALAKRAGISRRTLSRLENGEPTQLENLLRVLHALGLLAGLDELVPDVPPVPGAGSEAGGEGRQRASGRGAATPRSRRSS